MVRLSAVYKMRIPLQVGQDSINNIKLNQTQLNIQNNLLMIASYEAINMHTKLLTIKQLEN